MNILTRKLIASLCFVTALAAAQGPSGIQQPLPNRGCGTPTLPQQFETWLSGFVQQQQQQGKLSGGQIQSVFNIPVIVHVVHNNESLNSTSATSGGNLNAAQIIDQINILNKDFNGLNSDTSLIPSVFKPVQGKFQFNFCLAVVNPTGGILAEPGIDRINRVSKGWTAPPYTSSYVNNTIKPNSIWDPTKYMNMWVMNLASGLLGFATFPNPGSSGLSGISPPYGSTTTDGVVMLNAAFGSIGTAVNNSPYHKGRTTTHEVGHWLGLRHIWGDGTCATDYCNDTPPAQNANFGCPSHPYKSGVCSGNSTGEMFMNFMDYTNDACMYMFTNDQKYRAQLIMTNSTMRASLLTSTVCNAPTVTNEIGLTYVSSPTYSQVITCSNSINPVVVMHNFGSNTVTSATFSYNVNGINTQTMVWTGTLLPSSSATVAMPQVSNLSNGPKVYNVGVYQPNGLSDPNLTNNYDSQNFSITGSFTMNATAPASVCSGNSITLTVTGGATGYTWNPGTITGTSAVVSPTATTVYTVSGNLGSCINSRTLQVTAIPQVSLSVNSPSICPGGQAVLNVSGGCSYTWMPGNLTGSAVTVSPAGNTEYTVSTDCGGCSGVRVSTVTVMQVPNLTIAVSPSGSLCPGGTATLTAQGASGYTWSTGSIGNQLIVTPSVNTSYNVTGANGPCTSVSSASVTVGSASLTINISPSPATLCAGGTITLTASGANSYTWSGGGSSNELIVNPAANTTYTVSGINGACSATAMVTASVMPNPTVQAAAAPSGSVCAGSSVTLTAAGASDYLWSNSDITASTVVTPTATTSYTVTGSSSGCSNTQVHTVTVGAGTLGLAVTSTPGQICTGSSATLSASGLTSYSWSSGSNQPSAVVSPSATSTYTLNGANGPCPAMALVTVTVVPSPALSLAATPGTVCAGSSATLTASGAYSVFSWLPSGSGPVIVVAPPGNTTYSLNASGSAAGCSTTGTLTLIVAPQPVSVLNTTNTTCIDSVCNGGVSISSSGGTAPYTYNLNGGNCTGFPCNTLCQGLYMLTTTDLSGCKSYTYFSIECLPVDLTGVASYGQNVNTPVVFPNPARETITISAPPGFRFSLHNAVGQLLLEGGSDGNKKEIRVNEFTRGIYFITIRNGDRYYAKKLVIE